MGHKVYGCTTEVVWADRSTSRTEPKSYVLFQDSSLRGGSVVSSATEQGDASASSPGASASNLGDLVPFVSGDWDTDTSTQQPSPSEIQLRVLRGGSLYNTAEWGWRFSGDAQDQYRGMNDLRWLHDVDWPFGSSYGEGSQYTVCYSKAYNRVIIGYNPDGTNSLRYMYRSLATQGTGTSSWGSVLEVTFDANKNPGQGCSTMWELPDGALRWAYTYNPTEEPTKEEIDILGSVDGGETWVLIRERVLTSLWGAPRNIDCWKIQSAGDWNRLEIWDLDGSPFVGLVSAYSSDRGATWSFVTGASTPDGNDDTLGNSDGTFAAETWDFCNVDDSGTFMRVRGYSGAAKLRFELATRDGTYTQIANTSGAPFEASDADVVNVWCGNGAGRTYVLVFQSDFHSTPAGADYFTAASFIIPLDRLTAGWSSTDDPRIGDWAKWGGDDWLGYRGVVSYAPKFGQLAWIGDRMAFFRGSIRRAAGTTSVGWATGAFSYWGGTTRTPIHLEQNTHQDFQGALWTLSWTSAVGAAEGLGFISPYTPWSTTISGATFNWSPGGTEVSFSPGAYGTWYYNILASAITQSLADSGSAYFSTRSEGVVDIDSNPAIIGAAHLETPEWGFVCRSESTLTAGLTLALSVWLGGDGSINVYDVGAAATLYAGAAGTLAGITEGFYDFKLGFAHTQNIEGVAGTSRLYAQVAWAKQGDYAWTNTGLLTITNSGHTVSFQSVSFGNFKASSAVATQTFVWREFGFSEERHYGLVNFTNPDTLRGFSCVPFPVHAAQGISVNWGGGGGFVGDEYTIPITYRYGADQLFTDSPNSRWQSTTAVTQQFVLDATLINTDTRERFEHSGCAGVSTNSRYLWLEYSSESTFADPATIYLDGTRYTAVIAQIAEPASIKVTSRSWQDGELSGHYCLSQGASTKIHTKINSNSGLWLHLTGLTQALSSYSLAAGETIDIWGDQLLHAFDDWPEGIHVIDGSITVDGASPRYLRVTIPGAVYQGAPSEGVWKLGRLQAGLTNPINVPLAWESLNDTETPNVELSTMVSGARAAYLAGSPRKTWSGTSEGDVDRWRISFRSMTRTLAGYSVYPVVLCTNDLEENLRMLYSRFVDATSNANAGWKYNTDTGKWELIGDLQLTFEQEV